MIDGEVLLKNCENMYFKTRNDHREDLGFICNLITV